MTKTLFFLQVGFLFMACTKNDDNHKGTLRGTVLSEVAGCNRTPYNIVYTSIQSPDGKKDTVMTNSLPSGLAKVGATFTFNISQNNETPMACVQDKVYYPYKNLTDIETSK